MGSNDKPDRGTALGARLKFLREQWQQSVHDVCSTLEIDEKTLKAFESGSLMPSPEVLDMLINHFLLTEDQAQDLRELAEDQREDGQDNLSSAMEDMLTKQLVMFMPVDSRVVYTDSMQATINDNGVVLQFMQQAGNPNGQAVPVSKVGMSRMHAEKVIEVLQNTLRHHDEQGQKKLSSPDNKQS